MPPTKRPHERGLSLSLRPHKSARSLREEAEAALPSEDEMLVDDGGPREPRTGHYHGHRQTLWDNLRMISTSDPLVVPPLRFLGRMTKPLNTFYVRGVTVWPNNLAVIRQKLCCSRMPQHGRLLPEEVLELTSWKKKFSSNHAVVSGPARRAPYIHLGFIEWMEVDVYVVLPHCPTDVCIGGNLGRLQEHVLEAWTDRIWLPALPSIEMHAPTSWHCSSSLTPVPSWPDSTTAQRPASISTYELSKGGEYLAHIWARAKQNSEAIAEFRDPFLILHTDKGHKALYAGHSPEAVLQKFEEKWVEQMDMKYIGVDQDNLKLSVATDVVL